MNYRNITVAGSGVLGSQIAFQTAYKGFHVNVYDISDQVLGQAKERMTTLKDNYKEDLRATQQTVDEAFSRISFYADLAQAVADADLGIEATPEVAKIKFTKNIGMVALPLCKKQPGYILNSLLVPFLEAAQLLLMNQVADIETIDMTWMIATGAPEESFAILDAIGFNSAFNIVVTKANATRNPESCDPGKGQAWQSHGVRLLHLS